MGTAAAPAPPSMILNLLATSGLTGDPISAWSDGTNILTASGTARPAVGTDFEPDASVDFDGTSDTMELDPNPMVSTEGSMGLVFKTGTLTTVHMIIESWTTAGSLYTRFYIDGSDFVFESGDKTLTCNEAAADDDTEYQVLIVFDGTDIRIWINDVEQSFNVIGSGALHWFNDEELYVGATNVPDEFFPGSIGVIRSWNYALDAGERTDWSDYANDTWLSNWTPAVGPNIYDEDFEDADVPMGWINSSGTLHSTSSPLIGSKSYLLASSDQSSVDLSNTLALAGESMTIVMALKYSDATAGSSIFQLKSGGTVIAGVYLQASGVLSLNNTGFSINLNTVGTTSAATLFYIQVKYTVGSGANAVVSLAFSATTTFPTSGDNFVGVTDGTATELPTACVHICPADVSELRVDNFQVTTSVLRRNVVCDGDSITIGPTSTTNWPYVMQQSLGTAWRVGNVAVSTQNLDHIAADIEGESLRYGINPLSVATGQPIFVLWEYWNECGQPGRTAQQVYDKIVALAGDIRAAGFLVIIPLDFHNTASSGAVGTICHDTSELVRASHSFADAIVDLDLDSLRNVGVTMNADTVHLLDAGEVIVAGLIQTAVESL